MTFIYYTYKNNNLSPQINVLMLLGRYCFGHASVLDVCIDLHHVNKTSTVKYRSVQQAHNNLL